jgi:hypothetical protein
MTTTIDTLVPEQPWQAIRPLLPTPPPPLRRPTPRRRPRLPGRHRLPAAHRRSLAAAAHPPARLRQPGHLLAAAARLATRWRLAAAAPPAARPARPRGPDRLVPGEPGLVERARQRGAACLSAATPMTRCYWNRLWMPSGPVRGSRGRAGRPRKRPAKLHLDKAYDYPRCRRALCRRGVTPSIARRGVESRQRLGRHRYVVEWSLAWLVAAGGCRCATSGAPMSCLGSCTRPVR